MARKKSAASAASPEACIAAIDDAARREDCAALLALMRRATRQHPVMWGSAIVGFGVHRYPLAGGKTVMGLATLCSALLAACASTTVTFAPSPQAPVCDRTAAALVLWAPQWRPDQKDVAAREEAAATGLKLFFADAGCFANAEVRRSSDLGPATIDSALAAAGGRFDLVVTVAVRELGPVLALLSSSAMVEGGTEVALQIGARPIRPAGPAREFTVQWRHGGPGVVSGVASLPGDMAAALRAGLQPAPAAR